MAVMRLLQDAFSPLFAALHEISSKFVQGQLGVVRKSEADALASQRLSEALRSALDNFSKACFSGFAPLKSRRDLAIDIQYCITSLYVTIIFNNNFYIMSAVHPCIDTSTSPCHAMSCYVHIFRTFVATGSILVLEGF